MRKDNNSYREDISGDELDGFPVKGFTGKIIVVENGENIDQISKTLLKSPFIGFDTETKPSFKKGVRHRVALLQLSTENSVFLFRINRIGLPGKVRRVLEDPSVLKVGVAIHDDIKALKKIAPFRPAGFVELQELVSEFGIKSAGLKKLTAIILGFRISKRQQVSNWESEFLTDAQITYAATDAWVCHRIYKELIT